MFVTLLLAAVVTASAATDDETVRALLGRMKANDPHLAKRLEDFGYVEEVVEESGGKVKSRETFSVIFLKDRRVRRLTHRDGKPLAGSDLAKEDRRVEKLVTQPEKGKAPPLDNRRLRLEDLMNATAFSGLRHEQLQGRRVLFCEFHPRGAKFKPANASERFVNNLDGKLWIDEAALQIARVEFVLRDSFKVAGGLFFNMKPGTQFASEDTWCNGEIWLPKSRQFRMTARAMIGMKLDIRNAAAFREHHRFNVSASSSQSAVK